MERSWTEKYTQGNQTPFVSISYIGMEQKHYEKCIYPRTYVSISYIGMEQQHIVVFVIITPFYRFVNIKF